MELSRIICINIARHLYEYNLPGNCDIASVEKNLFANLDIFSTKMFYFTLHIFCAVTYWSQVEAHFGYSRSAQHQWHLKHDTCAGLLQSPIKIDSSTVIPLRMPAIETIGYHDLLPGPLKLHNNGHSVSLSVPKLNEKEGPYIFGGRLNNEYVLEGLHFHWGDKNNLGSEHIFNEVRYPLEMHIIHRNRKYSSTSDAVKHIDGLAVVAVFFQLREKENKQLAKIVRMLPYVEEYDTNVQINDTFLLGSLLPSPEDMEHFYMYRGSLTTPPCSEAITWILFPNPLFVSVTQMQKFRRLTGPNKKEQLVNNYREVQKLGRRRIFVRKLKPRGLKYNATIHYSEWDWLQ